MAVTTLEEQKIWGSYLLGEGRKKKEHYTVQYLYSHIRMNIFNSFYTLAGRIPASHWRSQLKRTLTKGKVKSIWIKGNIQPGNKITWALIATIVCIGKYSSILCSSLPMMEGQILVLRTILIRLLVSITISKQETEWWRAKEFN